MGEFLFFGFYLKRKGEVKEDVRSLLIYSMIIGTNSACCCVWNIWCLVGIWFNVVVGGEG